MKALYAIYQKHPQVYIDTRKPIQGGLFFAVGQKNDLGVHRGNEFAEEAIESGQAAYAVINDPLLKKRYADDKRFVLVAFSYCFIYYHFIYLTYNLSGFSIIHQLKISINYT